MPEISRFYGIVIYMFYNDHNPPHVHLKYRDFETVMDINSGEAVGEFPRRALKMVNEWIEIHKEELLENWALSKLRKPLNKIQPLN